MRCVGGGLSALAADLTALTAAFITALTAALKVALTAALTAAPSPDHAATPLLLSIPWLGPHSASLHLSACQALLDGDDDGYVDLEELLSGADEAFEVAADVQAASAGLMTSVVSQVAHEMAANRVRHGSRVEV